MLKIVLTGTILLLCAAFPHPANAADKVTIVLSTSDQDVSYQPYSPYAQQSGRNGGIILSKSFSAPGMLRDFVELVVPELQRRGLTRKKYADTTLRENLNS